MKVKKEDLLKIISILNKLSLIDEELIDITEAFSIKQNTKKKYNIPSSFYIKATNDREKEIVRAWCEENNSMYHSSAWMDNANKYFLLIKNGKYFCGKYNEETIESEFKKISFEEFEYFVKNPKIKHKKWFVLYSSREEFQEIDEHYQLFWGYLDSINKNGYCIDCSGGWVTSDSEDNSKEDLVKIGYIQISFEDWKENYK